MTTFGWIRGRNLYRLNAFAVLQIGPQLNRAGISARRQYLVARIHRGGHHVVAGRDLTVAEVQAAEGRLLRDESRAEEILLAHPVPSSSGGRLPEVNRAVLAATEPRWHSSGPHRLRLANLPALEPLLPPLRHTDLPWPEWDELGIPGPESALDGAIDLADIQFDL